MLNQGTPASLTTTVMVLASEAMALEPKPNMAAAAAQRDLDGGFTLAQRAALYALKTQDDRVRERTAVFGERMKYAASRLNAMKGVRCEEPNGSFYLFPDITGTGKTSEEFAWRLLDTAHVAVVPGTSFGASGEGCVRVACTLPMEGLAKAFDRMERALPSL